MSKTPTKTRSTVKPKDPRITAGADNNGILIAERIRIKLGYAGTRSLFNAVRLGKLLVFGLIGYLLAFMTAVRGIPNLMAAVQQGTGVTTKMPMDVVLAGWIVPSLFLVAMLFVLLLLIMRQLWRAFTKVQGRLEQALFSLDEDKNATSSAGVKP